MPRRKLEDLRLSELQEKYRELIGTSTRCPNKRWLVTKIREATAEHRRAQRRAPAETGDAARAGGRRGGATEASSTEAASPSTRSPRGRFSRMTIEELQVAYRDIVGRPTGSDDRAYLAWKIRAAERGSVRAGPLPDRGERTPGGVKTIPLRIRTEALRQLDQIWRARGSRSRTAFIKDAFAHYLRHLGENPALLAGAAAE